MGGGEPGAEHAYPRVAEYVVLTMDAEVVEEVVQLVHEELLSPEGLVPVFLWEMGGASASNLVVEDDGNLVRLHEIGEGEEIPVGDSRASV